MSIFQSPKSCVMDDTKPLSCIIESSYNLKDHTEYVLRIHFSSSSETSYTITKRYSDFAALDYVLKGYGIELPLPRKKVFGKMDSEFIEQRQIGLQKYLDALLNYQWVALSLEVRSFLCPEHYLHLDIHETALQNISMFLRSEEQWQLLALMPNIGWRLRKCYATVCDRLHPKAKYLLTWCTSGPYRTLEDRELEQSVKILTSLQHPGIEPALFATCNSNCMVVIRRFHDAGTVRDLLCNAKPSTHYLKKYANPKTCKVLQTSDLRVFGRQVLETLKFLQDKGFPYVHVHAGNVVIDDYHCRLLDLENSVLGLPSFHRRRYTQLRKLQTLEAVTVYCFGHLLYEMMSGRPLDATMSDVVPHGCPAELRSVLELTLSSAAIKSGLPSIEDLLRHPFFSGVPLPEGVSADIVQAKIPNKLKETYQKARASYEKHLRDEQRAIHQCRLLAKAQAIHMSEEERNKRRLQKMKSMSDVGRHDTSSPLSPGLQSLSLTVPNVQPVSGTTECNPAVDDDVTTSEVSDAVSSENVVPNGSVAITDDESNGGGRSALLTSITGFNKNCLRKAQSVDSFSQRPQ